MNPTLGLHISFSNAVLKEEIYLKDPEGRDLSPDNGEVIIQTQTITSMFQEEI